MEEHVILVDNSDNEYGAMEKLAAHRNGGICHRAFSIFVFNDAGDTLIQRRADGKYHSAGLWSNTVCGHPRPGETALQAAHRRLGEEMGFDCRLHEQFELLYRTRLDNGMVEHEYDHIIFGDFDGTPLMNPDEVQDYQWVSPSLLRREMQNNPKRYTPWLHLMIDAAIDHRLPAHDIRTPCRKEGVSP